jgi:HAD superfamily hydrolase (TIGR01509 family)
MPPQLVIFDCDGVLVDSEPISLAVTRDLLADLGCALDEAEGYAHLLGRSLPSVADWLRTARGLALTPAHLAELRARLFRRLHDELQPIPGIAEVVADLPMPVCVASSSQPDRIRLSLRLTELLDLFEPNIFSATEVAHGKPAPDLFLHAARAMGVPPEACLVVEDSPAGLAAAGAAGMRAVAFLGGSHAGPARLAEAVAEFPVIATLGSMAELPAVLRAAP